MRKNNSFVMMLALTASLVTTAAVAGNPVFYPQAPDQPRIQFLRTINGSSAFLPGNPYGGRFPGYEAPTAPETDGLAKPSGIALSNGKIFICDANAGVVKVFDMDKKYIMSMGEGKLQSPVGIAVDQDGTRYVADSSANLVFVFNSKNLYERSIGDAKKIKPVDVVLSKGKLYVADLKNSEILILDPKTGREISKTSRMTSEGVITPTHLSSSQDGSIYAADTLGGKLAVFSEEGKLLRTIGKSGDQWGEFARPKGVAVDREGRVYAVDTAFENIQVFNSDGRLLLPFGVAGNVPGGMNMPLSVVIDYDHVKYFKDSVAPGYAVDYLILVSNQFGNNKVNVYGFLKKL